MSTGRNNIWHPFTQMKEHEDSPPLMIEKGEGSYLIDSEGNRYIDGVSSLWVNIHGHSVSEIEDAVKNQLNSIGHSTLLGLSNPAAEDLAEKLVRAAPSGLSKVFFSGDGASAVEVAIKMAFQYWKNKGETRAKFIFLENGYHGDTLGAVSVGGIDMFHSAFKPLLSENFKAPSYYCYRCPLSKTYPSCGVACADEIDRICSEHLGEIAAVIIEPYVQAAGGMIVSPPGYLEKVREIADKRDVLLIVDEVATGFGRTGKMFACEHEDVCPDMMVLGKGLTGGYTALSATLTTKRVYEAFLGDYEEFKTFFHGHSYSGNPLACAAGVGNFMAFENRKTLEKLPEKIEFFENELKEFNSIENVGDVRNKGLMAGIELVKDKSTKEKYPAGEKMGWKVAEKAMDYGVLLRPLGDVVVLMPPVGIEMDDLKKLMKATYRAVREVATES
ncbi:MAG: adenosylmethionine--8-amino-7-oxononanoate transaminase [Candidatus Mycalebacterium zealandia]|nr:MAG: adenosylmethionine--8-amino-7-oxononanoate transaminase [Candidatus Mycalebacterium zealandia]